MTDEQVDRIVQALQGGGESWTTWAIPVLTLILGFGLAQLQDRFSARRRRAEEADRAKRSAVSAVKKLALTLGSTSHASLSDTTRWNVGVLAEALTPLVEIDSTVASWVSRQLNRLLASPADGAVAFTREEQDVRSDISVGVMQRLDKWVAETIASREFSAQNDQAWDALVQKTVRGQKSD